MEEGGHNFRRLKESILIRSHASDWEIAKKEWKLVRIYEVDEPETCLCGHTPIIEICVLSNASTGKFADVGNRCVKRFLGLRSDLIFTGIKRVKNDISKSLNVDATVFFFERGVINRWEYEFQNDTLKKRILTGPQRDKRMQINRKVLAYMERRGI